MENFWQKLNKPILALAPMAGVTDIAFRQMCKKFSADVIYTEFASSDALIYKSQKTLALLKYSENERPVVVQIFGQDPAHMAQAAKICEELGFDGIDINFGCPAYKVVKHGGGVNLMRKPKVCYQIVQAVIQAVKIPVSIKIRSSIKKETAKANKLTRLARPELSLELKDPANTDCNPINDADSVTATDLVTELNPLPIAAIMLHARSYERPFDGYPQVEIVKKLRKIYSGVLIHNGGVYTPEIAKELLKQTKADGLGIARGAWGSPWLFQLIKNYLHTGKYSKPTEAEIKKYILEHAELALQEKGAHGLVELRKHLAWYVKGWPEAKKLRAQLVQTSTLAEITAILKKV